MNSIMKKPKAYSYIRWSSAIQGEGDSDRRQTEQAENYAAEHGLDLVPENMMKDEGMSAFTGKNLSEGEFGAFMKAVDAGKIERGSYLLVEAHDRLSRQEPEQAVQTFLNIISKGIVVVTLQDGIEYRTGEMDMMKLFGSIIKMSVAHEESDKKRKRGKANWESKRQKAMADGHKLSRICPNWLTLSEDRKSFIVNEDKANTIKRIFQMSLEGFGTYKIAQIMNEKNVPTLAGAKAWRADTISFMMKSKTLIGQYQPKKRIENTGKKVPVGEPILDYYPAIISEEIFYANLSAFQRRWCNGKGRKGKILSNIFSGLVNCDCCGTRMYTNKRSGLYYCKNVMNGLCDARSWSYNRFEQVMLSFVNEIDLESIINGGTSSRLAEISFGIDRLEGEKVDIESKANRLLTLFENNDFSNDMAMERLKGFQKSLDDLNSQIKQLNDERLEVQEDKRVTKNHKVFRFPDDISEQELYGLRAKAAEHIRSIIEEIRFVRVNGSIQKYVDMDSSGLDMTSNDVRNKVLKYGQDTMITVRFKGGATRVLLPNTNASSKAIKVRNWPVDLGRIGKAVSKIVAG